MKSKVITKKEMKNLISDYLDVLEHDRLYYWTYKKSLNVFAGIIDIAYENKAIGKTTYKRIKKFVEYEYKERFNESIYDGKGI